MKNKKGFTKDTKRNTEINIGPEGRRAIEKDKQIFSTRPILSFPRWILTDIHQFKVYGDGTIDVFGVVIMQNQENRDNKITPRLILFDIRRTTTAKRSNDSN